MKNLVVVFAGLVMASLSLISISPSAQATEQERVWSKALILGETEYLTFHGNMDSWQVDLSDEMPGQLPALVWRKDFAREAEAVQFAAETASKMFFDTDSLQAPAVLPSAAAVTEVSGAALWKVTQNWNWDWELRYSEWVAKETSPLFFKQNSIPTDCADVAYSLRWIFARINGLPAANRLMGSGVMFSQDSVKAEWRDLPTDADWRRDRRFLAALDYLLELTYTHTLMRDSYPIAISPESLITGTHHLELHGESGHTMVVYKMDLSDTSLSPIEVMYSTTPRTVRELMHNGYWNNQQPTEEKGGFLRIRWPLKKGQTWELAAPESEPFFSKEQYTKEFLGTNKSFAEAVLLKLNPKFDYRARLREGIQYLKDQIAFRANLVEQGYAYCLHADCREGTTGDENWGTEARDGRLRNLVRQLQTMVWDMSKSIDDFEKDWNAALKEPVLNLGSESYSLGEVVFGWKIGTFSSDPRVLPALRWGLAPEPFMKGLGRRLDALLTERVKRMGTQGTRCSQTGACAPGTDAWRSYNTFELDDEITAISSAVVNYCDAAPVARCEAGARLVSGIRAGDVIGKGMTIGQWSELGLWLNSDPRVTEAVRWGSQRERYRSFALNIPAIPLMSATGLAITQRVYGPDLDRRRVFDLISAKELTPPAGMFWVDMDPKHDWLVAQSLVPDSAGKFTTQVLKPDGTPIYSVQTVDFSSADWVNPGVLRLLSTKNGASLFDLTTAPVFQAQGLPLPFLVRGDGSWIPAGNHDTFELVSYNKGVVRRFPFPRSISGNVRPTYLQRGVENFAIGNYGRCESVGCQTIYVGTFAMNLKNGAVSFPAGERDAFFPTYDAKYAVINHFSPTASSCELVQYDSNLTPVSRKSLGQMMFTFDNFDHAFYGLVHSEGVHSKYIRYRAGVWSEFQLLPDEKDFTDTKGDFAVLKTLSGTSRLRHFADSRTLFETDAESLLAINGTRNDGQELPTVLAWRKDRPEQVLTYDLREISTPLFTSNLRTSFAQPTPRGLMISSGPRMKLWIEDQR
jgi:hypothetical protein